MLTEIYLLYGNISTRSLGVSFNQAKYQDKNQFRKNRNLNINSIIGEALYCAIIRYNEAFELFLQQTRCFASNTHLNHIFVRAILFNFEATPNRVLSLDILLILFQIQVPNNCNTRK